MYKYTLELRADELGISHLLLLVSISSQTSGPSLNAFSNEMAPNPIFF
jgi:hypothetical protein